MPCTSTQTLLWGCIGLLTDGSKARAEHEGGSDLLACQRATKQQQQTAKGAPAQMMTSPGYRFACYGCSETCACMTIQLSQQRSSQPGKWCVSHTAIIVSDATGAIRHHWRRYTDAAHLHLQQVKSMLVSLSELHHLWASAGHHLHLGQRRGGPVSAGKGISLVALQQSQVPRGSSAQQGVLHLLQKRALCR